MRLFRRTRAKHHSPVAPYVIPVYFIAIFGRKRARLTSDYLYRLAERHCTPTVDPVAPQEEERLSLVSFFTCLSTFQDESTSTPHDLTEPLLGASHAFLHYISHSNLRRIAMESLEKMKRHFAEDCVWNEEDTMGKYLCPGLGWDVRPDEIGPNVQNVTEMKRIAGYWRTDMECSDDPGLLIDVMEMPWIYKKAARLIHYSEVQATDEKISMNPKVLGLTFPTVSYWTREGRIGPRRDLRKGIARISTVPTTFGFRQFVQWGQPYAGFAAVEGQLSQDLNSFETLTFIQRYEGQHCCMRSIFRRVLK